MSTDEIPPQPKTAELPAADPIAILTRTLVTGLRDINATLDSVVHEGQRTNSRLTRIEERVDEVEGRIGRNSQRVQESSKVDLDHEAKLAAEIIARQELASKVDSLTETQATQLAILGRLDKVASNPTIKVLAGMLATALFTWLASHGVHAP
jgi:septal ring factor EnvC (AmiA/AmiB activator)